MRVLVALLNFFVIISSTVAFSADKSKLDKNVPEYASSLLQDTVSCIPVLEEAVAAKPGLRRSNKIPKSDLDRFALPDVAPKAEIVNTRKPKIKFGWMIEVEEVTTPESAQAVREIERQLQALKFSIDSTRKSVSKTSDAFTALEDLSKEIRFIIMEIHEARDNGFSQESTIEIVVRYLALFDRLATGFSSGKSVLGFNRDAYTSLVKSRLDRMETIYRKLGHVFRPRIIFTLAQVNTIDLIRMRASGVWLIHLPVLSNETLSSVNPWKLWDEQWKRALRLLENDRDEFLHAVLGRNFVKKRQDQNQQLQQIYSFLILNEFKPIGRLMLRFFERTLVEDGRTLGWLKRHYSKKFFREYMKPDIELGKYSEAVVREAETRLRGQIGPSPWYWFN